MLGRLVMQGSAVPDSRQLRKSHTTQLKIRSFFFNKGENPIGLLLGKKATNNVLELCISGCPPPHPRRNDASTAFFWRFHHLQGHNLTPIEVSKQRQQREGSESADVISVTLWEQQPVYASDIRHDGSNVQLIWL